MHQLIRSKFLTPSIILLIFIIDLAVPPGTAISVLYVVSLVISITLSNKKIITAAAISTILTIMDTTSLYYNPEMHHSIIANRILSISAIWISCYIILRKKNLRKQKDKEKEKHLNSINEIIFKISHQVRSPLCRIQGLTNHIDSHAITKEELESISIHLKSSVTELDTFTRTLTKFLEKIRIQSTHEQTYYN